MAEPSYTDVGDYDKPDLPVPPVSANTDASGYGVSIPKAWAAAEGAAATDYAGRDDGSGNISATGSYSGRTAADLTDPAALTQTYEGAKEFF